MQKGMALAIEPMIKEGTYDVYWLDNDWTVARQMESFLLIMRIRLRLLMMDARFLRCCQKRKRHLEYYKNDTAMNNKQKEK